MAQLIDLLPRVLTSEQAGFDGDAMEAEAWAYLAIRSKKQLPISFPATTGISQPMQGGRLATPVLLPGTL
jgi:anhydro-N-acetylmuramic acid kinase